MTDYMIIFHFTFGMPDLEHTFSCANDGYAMTQAERYVKALESNALRYAQVWRIGERDEDPSFVARLEVTRAVRVETTQRSGA